MRRSRAIFKYMLRKCKKEHLQIKADSMAKSLLRSRGEKSSVNFWKQVKKTANSKVPDTLEGISGSKNIADF